MNQNKIIACCWIVLTSCYCTGLSALESDADQPITIDSNTATYDDATSTSIYTGNVISIQGSIKVNSDKLVVYFLDGEADKLVFTGNKAKFRQTPSVGADDVTGEALTGSITRRKISWYSSKKRQFGKATAPIPAITSNTTVKPRW